MQIDGSLSRNLESARRSAQRLRGRQVYPDTLHYWQSLLDDARAVLGKSSAPDACKLERLVVSIEAELADRTLLH